MSLFAYPACDFGPVCVPAIYERAALRTATLSIWRHASTTLDVERSQECEYYNDNRTIDGADVLPRGGESIVV